MHRNRHANNDGLALGKAGALEETVMNGNSQHINTRKDWFWSKTIVIQKDFVTRGNYP